MKDDDGCNVSNMNSQNLKEIDSDDPNKDDNKECPFYNIAASDQQSENSSSKNSEISECDSGVASSQDSLCQVNISSDKTKLSHSYFNSRTGTSFIHINSINRPVVRNNQTNTYFEKEWEILKRKMMKPSIVSSVHMKQSSESLEEQKKDISFIDEPEAINQTSLLNFTLNKHNNEYNMDTENIKGSASFSKESIHKNSQLSKSQSENIISKALKNEPICQLTSSFYEPTSCKDDYIKSSFSKTFLNNPVTTAIQNSTNKTCNNSKIPQSSSVFFKPLSSIRTSLSHSTTEMVSCTYSPVSSSSIFNPSNHNPFKTHSYRDEFLSLDPNYSTKHTPPIFQPSTNSTGGPLVSSDLHHTPSFSSTHTFPPNCFSTLSKNHNDKVNRVAEEIELETFTPSQNHNYNNCNSAKNINNKPLPFIEISPYQDATQNTRQQVTTATPTTLSTLQSGNTSIEADVSNKSDKYIEMQKRRQRNKKVANASSIISTPSDHKAPDNVASKSLEEIMNFICPTEHKSMLEKNHKKSKKKPSDNGVGKEGGKHFQGSDRNDTNQKGKETKSKGSHVHHDAEEKLLNGGNEDTSLRNVSVGNEKEKIKKELTPTECHQHECSITSTQGLKKKKIKNHEIVNGMGLETVDDIVKRTESSINSLDHIDKFTNVMPHFKKQANKEATSDIDIKPPPLTLQLPTKNKTILFSNCDIELDSKLILTDDQPKIGTFSVVTKRKKIKTKHHSNDSQDSNIKSNIMSSSLNSHFLPEKTSFNSKSRFNSSQSKPNSAKTKCKNLEAPKVSQLPPQCSKKNKLFTSSNDKNTSNKRSTEVKDIVRPISSPQLVTMTSNPQNITPVSSQSVSTKSNPSHPNTYHPKSTYSSKLKYTQANEVTKSTQSNLNNQPSTSGNNFFLDTKNLVKPQKNADFMFGYDGDLPDCNHTKTSNITQIISTVKKSNVSESNGGDALQSTFSDNNSRDDFISSLTFVHNSDINITLEQTTNTISNPMLSPSSPLSTSTNPSSTQPIPHHSSRDNLSDSTSLSENTDVGFVLPVQPMIHHPSIPQPQLSSQHTLQQHQLENYHLHTPQTFQHVNSSQHQQLSPQQIILTQQNLSPEQKQATSFGQIPNWFMPFKMPMMVLPNNIPNNTHHYTNIPSNNPYNVNNPNNPYQNQHILTSDTSNNISNIHHPDNLPQMQSSHHNHNSIHHRKPKSFQSSKDNKNNSDSQTHASFRQNNHKFKDTQSNIQHSLATQNSKINHLKTEKVGSENQGMENSSSDCNKRILQSHSRNMTSSSSSPSPVASSYSGSPPSSPNLPTVTSNNKNHFNLTKAQIYLDSIFKEVINSKDVIVHQASN